MNGLGWHLAYRILSVKRVKECVLHQDTINSVENEEEEIAGECFKNSA